MEVLRALDRSISGATRRCYAPHDRLRRLYVDAVDRLAGAVRYATCGEFKDASDCLGNFKGQPNPVTAWCQVNNGARQHSRADPEIDPEVRRGPCWVGC